MVTTSRALAALLWNQMARVKTRVRSTESQSISSKLPIPSDDYYLNFKHLDGVNLRESLFRITQTHDKSHVKLLYL
jgi:hypothetical protein